MRQHIVIAAICFALSVVVGLGVTGCEQSCQTDNDCGEGKLCVNGSCVVNDSKDPDGGALVDSGVADHGAADRAVADQSRAQDAMARDSNAPPDAALRDTAATDRGTVSDANAADATAADRTANDLNRVDSSAPDTSSPEDATRPDATLPQGSVGTACGGDEDCTAPDWATCVQGFPGGYCGATCNYGIEDYQGECGEHAGCFCVEYSSMTKMCITSYCYAYCDSDLDCRDGYGCYDSAFELEIGGWGDICYPTL